jgi:phosphatidylglycerol:prolipoprotein diacylglycerol transferase
MKSVLLQLPPPSLVATLILLAALAVGLGVWLVLLKRRGKLGSDAVITAVVSLVVAAVVLVILGRMPLIRINAYGSALMVGFVVGILSAVRLGRRRGVPGDRIIDLGLWILVGALIGARAMYLVLTPGAGPFFDMSTVLNQGLGGLSFHGGLLGGLVAGSAYIFLMKLPYWRVTDCVAPGIALGYAVTRIGCFLNGCCFGKETHLPWGMIFPDSPELYARTFHVHPTQLYASLMGLAMFGILLLLARGNSLGRAGRLFMVFLILEGVERFVMEIFRYPAPGDIATFTMAQKASVVIIILGIIGWNLLPKRTAVDETPAPATPAAK